MSTEIIFEEEQTHLTIFDEEGGTFFDDVLRIWTLWLKIEI